MVAPTVWCGLRPSRSVRRHLHPQSLHLPRRAQGPVSLDPECRLPPHRDRQRPWRQHSGAGHSHRRIDARSSMRRSRRRPISWKGEMMPRSSRIRRRDACLRSETSMMMVVHPASSMRRGSTRPLGRASTSGLAGAVAEIVQIVRRHHGLRRRGDARKASAAKGEKLLAGCAASLAARLRAGEPWSTATTPPPAAR